jgi:hypothetical protein
VTTAGGEVPGTPATDGTSLAGGRYHAYGLEFASTIPIPEMRVVEEEPLAGGCDADVSIEVGPVPDHLPDPINVGVIYESNATELLVRISNVARYWISNGRRIVIDPAPDVTDHEVRVFLLGTCIGALLHQRGFFVFHASGIGTSDGAVLFAGMSGAGKSTLLAELLRRGYRMMVDDVCAISVGSDGHPEVIPSYPRTRLWGETAARLSIETEGLTRTRPTMDKYERQLPEQFWNEVAPLRRIYHLTGSNGDELSLTPLGSLESFQVVRSNTYRDALVDGFSLRREHFELASAVARAADVVRVVRPVDSFRLVELADLILDDLASR